MKRLLITGGCGFVGVNLVDFLQKETDYDIVVLDNLSLGRKEYLEPYRISVVTGDIRNPAVVGEAVAGVSAIVHLAADTEVIELISESSLELRGQRHWDVQFDRGCEKSRN